MRILRQDCRVLYRSGLSSLLIILIAAGTAICFAACGGNNMGVPGPIRGQNTSVALLATSTANDQFSEFGINFSSLTLKSQSGNVVNLLANPQLAEFIHLNGTVEPVVTLNVPQDVYTSATATLKGAGFTCISLIPAQNAIQTSEFGPNGGLSATVTMPSPITVAGTAMGLLLNLQVGKSVTTSSCNLNGAIYTLTPTFTLTPVALASPPTSVANGKLNGLEGQIASVEAAANSLSVVAADGPSWTVHANANTVFQGVPAFSTLVAGMPVNMDAVIQSDGSLLATRVAVEDTNPTNLTVWSGPVMNVSSAIPVLLTLGVEQQGQLVLASPTYYSFGNAIFQISGQFTNLQSLPFAASFDATNMVAGQNIYVSTHALNISPEPIYTPAATVTLLPQTINGTVSQISSAGNFTTYTVSLAAYDLIPALAVQPGQTTLLNNPSSVVVYVDADTQLLNTQPIAQGSLLRFNGLLFNDNGTLRMDCGQVNDGVTE